MLLLRFALPAETRDAKSHLLDGQIIAPLSTIGESLYKINDFNSSSKNYVDPFQWCKDVIKYDWTWALVSPQDSANSLVLEGYLTDEIGQYLSNSTGYKPPRYFKDENGLEDYITDGDYNDKNTQKICFAVVINRKNDAIGDYEVESVSIRYNMTDTDPDNQSVYGSFWDIFLTSQIPPVNKYQKSVTLTYQRNFVESGFLNIQNMIYNFYIGKSAPGAYMQWAFVPMHGMKYTQDLFMINFAGTIGFFMFITSLVPVSRLINKMTIEKETKVKEAMKMMGLTDTPY